jgi:small subunit ribosomal protein S8
MDKIANMLISIKNGGIAHKETVMVPFSIYKADIAQALLKTGYISGYEKKDRKRGGALLAVTLRYNDAGESRITQVQRVSKPSRRLYAGVKNMYPVKHGRGHVFLSTPKGVMSGDEAEKERVGGEILFEIW